MSLYESKVSQFCSFPYGFLDLSLNCHPSFPTPLKSVYCLAVGLCICFHLLLGEASLMTGWSRHHSINIIRHHFIAFFPQVMFGSILCLLAFLSQSPGPQVSLQLHVLWLDDSHGRHAHFGRKTEVGKRGEWGSRVG